MNFLWASRGCVAVFVHICVVPSGLGRFGVSNLDGSDLKNQVLIQQHGTTIYCVRGTRTRGRSPGGKLAIKQAGVQTLGKTNKLPAEVSHHSANRRTSTTNSEMKAGGQVEGAAVRPATGPFPWPVCPGPWSPMVTEQQSCLRLRWEVPPKVLSGCNCQS